MRVDARNLLDRLGRSNFSYKEFEDRFTELELWPLLESLLRDPRLQALDSTHAASPADSPDADSGQAAPMQIDALFRRYDTTRQDGGHDAPKAQAPAGEDVRAMLRRLSELGDKGAL